MKIRKDFVTNSSSSSFICEICGQEGSGFDVSLSDFDMCECENGHIICCEHLLNPSREEKINMILENKYWNKETDKSFIREELEAMDDEYLYDILLSGYYEIPESLCPICQFKQYSTEDMASFLLTEYKIPKAVVFAEIKKQNKRRRKLYAFEYNDYVSKLLSLNLTDIQKSWKDRYHTYKEFMESIDRF